jgi:Tfp pilus assembly protein PilX
MKPVPVCARRGIAMTAAIMTIMILAILAAVVLNLALNQARLAGAPVQGRTRAFFRAQAGLVDAKERIRIGSCPACKGACASCDTACATCPYELDATTANYTLDVEGDAVQDTTVTISARNTTTKLRTITSNGSEL